MSILHIIDNKQTIEYNNVDLNKDLNSRCWCGEYLFKSDTKIAMVDPCEHLYHEDCLYIMNSTVVRKYCFFCSKQIEKVVRLSDPIINYQKFADILSVTNYTKNISLYSKVSISHYLFDIVIQLSSIRKRTEALKYCKKIFDIAKINVHIQNFEKIDSASNYVIICNHVSYLEFLLIYYLYDTAFLVNSSAYNTPLFGLLKNFIKFIPVTRGKKNNIVKTMTNYVENKGNLCIFPEGMIKNQKTLVSFRSGAFYINKPIISLTLDYHNRILHNEDFFQFIINLSNNEKSVIDAHINGPYIPPFNQNDIKNIRQDMARSANLILSRVSNKDIKD